jgi:hypothetical protein
MCDADVDAAAVVGDRLYVLAGNRVGEVRNGEVSCWFSAHRATHLAGALDLLVLADDDGLSVVSPTDPSHRLSRFEIDVESISATVGRSPRRQIGVQVSPSAAVVVDLSDPTRPRKTGDYPEGLPMHDVVTLGHTHVRTDPSGLSGVVLSAGPTSLG